MCHWAQEQCPMPSRGCLSISRNEIKQGKNCFGCTFSSDHLGALSVLEMHSKARVLIQHHSEAKHKTYSCQASSLIFYLNNNDEYCLVILDYWQITNQTALFPINASEQLFFFFSDKGFNIPWRFSTNRRKYTDHIIWESDFTF